MPDASITMHKSKSLHEILITKISYNTSDKQRIIDSNTLKTMLHNDVNAKSIVQKPAVLLKKHTNDPVIYVKNKLEGFDSAVLPPILTNQFASLDIAHHT